MGFIRNLPHRLVEAFKSTLEEAVLADFLIQVVDASIRKPCAIMKRLWRFSMNWVRVISP